MAKIINLELEGTWDVRVQLGNWVGVIKIPKTLVPEARDANQKIIDLGWDWVNKQK